jgi:8-oxo-dGTP diphosphatase
MLLITLLFLLLWGLSLPLGHKNSSTYISALLINTRLIKRVFFGLKHGTITSMKSAKQTKQITVVVGVMIKDNNVLMVQRFEPECPEAHLKWEFAGGKVDYGESVQEALKREIYEETGIVASVGSIIDYVETNYWEYAWGTQQTLVFGFCCNFIRQEVVEKDHHTNAVEWVPIEEAYKRDCLPAVKELIANALKKASSDI